MSIVTSTVLKEIGKAFSLKTANDLEMFDDLWEVYQIGNKYRRDNEERMATAVEEAYTGLTDIVAGRKTSASHGLERVGRTRATRLVVFSDHHMTHSGHRHNYFNTFNAALYRDVLKRYADDGVTLVENGDVEELLIFEPTIAEAEKRRKLVRRPTLGLDDIGTIDWAELDGIRVEKRRQDLERMITDNRLYYDSVRAFGRERYIKLSGNHDRYASSLLEGMIESVYWTGVVKDVLLLDRPVSGSRTRDLPNPSTLTATSSTTPACRRTPTRSASRSPSASRGRSRGPTAPGASATRATGRRPGRRPSPTSSARWRPSRSRRAIPTWSCFSRF